jgi:hypothetical protein
MKNIGFIEVIGNADLSIRNNLLYADSYVDLVWFDVSNPALPVLKGRLEDIFPKALPGVENNFSFDYDMCFNQETDKGIVVGWKLRERTEKFEQYTGGWFWGWAEKDGAYTSNGTASGSTNGINGSMSRFTLYNNNLYAVTENQMTIFDLTGTEPQKAAESIFIGWNVETIFSYKDNMFMGTPTGMLIYSVTDPLKPVFQSSITHIFGCDPVVVDNDLAYVTIHSGDNCGQKNNELFIVDVSDVKNPKQLVSYTMKNPKGLGVDKGMLFLCDDGLKIYKITTPNTLMNNELVHYSGIEVYDLLRDEYDIQIEFGDICNILAYISIGDRIQDIERLVGALQDIKRLYSRDRTGLLSGEYINPEVAVSPQKAFYAEKKSLSIKDSVGCISGEFVMCYPPGIPILAPGERITKEIAEYILYAKEKGCSMQGTEDPAVEYFLCLVKVRLQKKN